MRVILTHPGLMGTTDEYLCVTGQSSTYPHARAELTMECVGLLNSAAIQPRFSCRVREG